MINPLFSCRVLSQSEMAKIHEKSLSILERVGIKIPHEKCLDVLVQAGARIDGGSKKVTFPKTLVEDCLKKVPKHLFMEERNPKFDIVIPHPEQDFYTRTAIGQSGYIDSETGNFRPTTISDQAEWARVTDALDAINCCAISFAPGCPPIDHQHPCFEGDDGEYGKTPHASGVFGGVFGIPGPDGDCGDGE